VTVRPQKIKAASVDEYVAQLGPQARALTQRLRVIVRKALPDAVEVIKWGNPVYVVNGKNVAWILNYRNHLDLGFFMGMRLQSQLLEGTGKGLRHIKVRSAGDIREAEFTRLLIDAAALAQ
jgi:hypothetical protein